MKFCQDHWDELRTRTIDAGMEHLIPKSGEDAALALADQSRKGAATPVNFDPLMGAHNAILSNAMELAGFQAIMCPNDDGSERCPLCYIIAEAPRRNGDPEYFKSWPEFAVRDMRSQAEALGLVKDNPKSD